MTTNDWALLNRNTETAKHLNSETAKHRNNETAKHRSRGTPKQRKYRNETSKHRNETSKIPKHRNETPKYHFFFQFFFSLRNTETAGLQIRSLFRKNKQGMHVLLKPNGEIFGLGRKFIFI